MNKIKERRKELGYRLIDLARLTGLSIGQIWNVENGLAHRTRPETREKISRVLGLPAQELFPEDGSIAENGHTAHH